MRKVLSRCDTAPAVLILWLLAASSTALAQRFEAGGNFAVGLPQREFRDNIDTQGYGLTGHFGAFVADSPIMIGAVLGYLNYGTEKRWEPISETIPDVTVEVRTTNNIFLLHGFARVQPQRGPVRPYVEGLWGFKYLFTQTSIRDDSIVADTVASSTNFDDFAGSWGVASGVDIRLWDGRWQHGHGNLEISLNVSAKYLWGSEAEYLKKGSIQRFPDGSIGYFVMRSETDMLVPQVGLRIRF
jgi:hypothetical protein